MRAGGSVPLEGGRALEVSRVEATGAVLFRDGVQELEVTRSEFAADVRGSLLRVVVAFQVPPASFDALVDAMFEVS